MAFARHNIEKRRLIELVRLNPILWDCRLPHYKRSDKLKAIKWHELGKTFAVSGERVQRTFTSLREIFRRELNHEKLVGTQYKSKWEYYEAMAFLREVIRERKPRERTKGGANAANTATSTSEPDLQHGQLNAPIDEYSYFAPNDPNNPIIQRMQQQQQAHNQATQTLRPDLLMNLNTNILSDFLAKYKRPAAPPTNGPTCATDSQPQLAQRSSPQRCDTPLALSSTLSAAHSPLVYIKDEPLDESADDGDSLRTHEPTPKRTRRAHSVSVEQRGQHAAVAVTRCLSAQPLAIEARPPAHVHDGDTAESHVRPPVVDATDEDGDDDDDGDGDDDVEDDEDEDEEDLLEDEEEANERVAVLDDIDDVDVDVDVELELGCLGPEIDLTAAHDSRLSCASLAPNAHQPDAMHRTRPPRHCVDRGSCIASVPNSAKEILYMKFGDFLAARLNALTEPAANELMNKILMLIAEK